ncbi:ferritin, heavy subunit-like [Artibeus jamaicensis]|uniref:ferritin, heavy subunit-like n=1 Tax=Artibeus jamaicensis TaxID=9417 RepID=UPI00235A741C|nr:ferritin, heavy subunit-like [Artibeus jamaicensis]
MSQHQLSEASQLAVNRVASYQLHMSDAYLSMACYYNEDTGAPLFASFFEDQAEVKREHGRQFLKYLRKRGCKICLPVIKRPDIDNWATGVKALESALEMEKELSKLLQDLKIASYEKSEKDLVRLLGRYLEKQKRNTSYLEHQIAYHKNLEEKQAQEEEQFKKPAEEASGSLSGKLMVN